MGLVANYNVWLCMALLLFINNVPAAGFCVGIWPTAVGNVLDLLSLLVWQSSRTRELLSERHGWSQPLPEGSCQ